MKIIWQSSFAWRVSEFECGWRLTKSCIFLNSCIRPYWKRCWVHIVDHKLNLLMWIGLLLLLYKLRQLMICTLAYALTLLLLLWLNELLLVLRSKFSRFHYTAHNSRLTLSYCHVAIALKLWIVTFGLFGYWIFKQTSW